MAGSATARAALLGLSRSRLRQMARGERARGMSQDESDRVGREARAASEILEAMNEERLERIASAQLAGMTKPDYLTAVEAAQLAETALVLAKYLAAYLDKEG